MAARNHDALHANINAKLAQLAASSPTPPPWHAPWTRLGPHASEEERLAVYRAVRDAGSVPAEAGFYLVSWQIDVLTMGTVEKALRKHEERLEALRRKHGLDEDEPWIPGAGPAEYEVARRQMHEAWGTLYAAQLDAFGEIEMARLFRTDREGFDQRSEQGRQFFHGPPGGSSAEDALAGRLSGCHRRLRRAH